MIAYRGIVLRIFALHEISKISNADSTFSGLTWVFAGHMHFDTTWPVSKADKFARNLELCTLFTSVKAVNSLYKFTPQAGAIKLKASLLKYFHVA